MSFWQNDPVVGGAAQSGVQPVFTVPDPRADIESRRDNATITRTEQEIAQNNATAPADARKAAADAEIAELNAAALRAKMSKTQGDARGELQRLITEIDAIAADASDNGGWFETGFFGSRLRDVPGTAAYGLQKRLATLDANAAFRALQQMRESSPTGGALGQITERELDLLKATIADLNPNQSQGDFLAQLAKSREYYSDLISKIPAPEAGAENVQGSQPTGQEDRAPPGVEYRTGGGDSNFVTEDDKRFTTMLQSAWDQGATIEELDALSTQNGYMPVSAKEGIQDLLSAREQGGRVDWAPQATGERTAIERAVSSAADSDAGAYFTGAANAMTAGTLDEIAGAVGGEGAAERTQFAKEYMRDRSPIASFAGEVTGGALAMLPAARIAQAGGRAALAGEVAYGAAYGAGENNENRIAGAAIGAGGAAAGDYLGRKLLQRFGRKIPAEAGREGVEEAVESLPDALTPAQRYERAQRYGIDLSIGDVRGRSAKVVERTLDNMPGGGSVTNAARDRTRAQLGDAVDTVGGSFGTAATASSMGDALQTGARKWIARVKGEKGNPLDRGIIGKAYDAIPIGSNSPAKRENTLAALEEVNEQFSSNPKLRELMQDSQASRLLDALGDADSELSWSDLKALRSAVGEDMNAFRIGSQGSRQSTLSRLYGALSEDMRATAQARGPAALAKFERANSLNRAVEARIENTLSAILGKDGMQSAERAAEKLRAMAMSGKSTSDFRQLAEIRKSIPAAEWGEVSGALVRLLGQPAKSEGRDFAPQTFVRNFQDMSTAAKNLIFGGSNSTLRKNLDEFAEVVGDIAGSDATRNASNTGMVVTGALGLTAGLPTLAAQALTSYGAARLWTHAPFVRWATGYTRMLKKAEASGSAPAATALKAQLGHLDRIARGGGPVSADIIVFRDYLSNAVSQSPERLAAEPTEGDRQ